MAGNVVRITALLDDKVSSGLAKIDGKFSNLTKSKGFTQFTQGVGMGAGMTAFNALGSAAGAVLDEFQSDIKAASDLNETMSKSQIVFGDSARQVSKWGDTTAQAMGLSKQAAIEAAASLGNLFEGADVNQAKAADMSEAMVQLAGDLASFNNIDPTDALDKLRSGLVGEAEPLRTLGVTLSEAKVKAKAMQLGLGDAHGELTEGEKILARYQVILDETTTAQGDFARTADGLANSQRTLNAEMENQRAEMGEKLLPVQKSVTQAQLALITGTERLGSIFNIAAAQFSDAAISTEDYANALEVAERFGQVAAGTAAKYRQKVDEETAALTAFDRHSEGAASAMSHLSAGMDHAATSADETKKAFDDMTAALIKDADRLLDDVYDPTIERDNLAANKAEINAAKRVLASSKASTAEKRDARETLHQLAKDQTELYLKLLESGDITKTEYHRLLSSLQAKSKTSTGAAKADIDELIARAKKLYSVLISGPKVKINVAWRSYNDKGKAIGGPVYPHEAYTVGEKGPETLVMGDQSGYVIPHGAGGTGGSPIVIHTHVTLDGREIARAVSGPLSYELSRAARTSVRT